MSPERMQRVQTRMRITRPPRTTRTLWMLGCQIRMVLRWEWLTLCPYWIVLLQISHFLDISDLRIPKRN